MTPPWRPSRRGAVGGMAGALALGATRAHAQERAFEWRHYGADLAATKYAPLDLLNADNVGRLTVAWEWESPDAAVLAANPALAPGEFQCTPIFAEGKLIVTTAMSQIAALDPRTGRTLWRYDPESWRRGPNSSKGFLHRGVAVWGQGRRARVIAALGDGRLIALRLSDGALVRGFGAGGAVDLRAAGWAARVADDPGLFCVTSPPLVCGDTIIVGSSIDDRADSRRMPRGDVRAFDAASGRLKWIFHTIPMEGEFGHETWLDGAAERTGNTNVWAPMSADPELGLVYLPISAPTNNFFGGDRPGDGLFGNSLVALDVETGERAWHYQIVRHDIWDYDLPAAPILSDVVINGERRAIVTQLTKHGYAFVFDRRTGAPIWPIEDRPAPPSPLTGEHASAMQPHPTWPAPFERQGVSDDDLIDFTPSLHAEARALLQTYESGPLFTPLSTRPTIVMPSFVGGANWNGAAFDPESGRIFIPSVTVPLTLALREDGAIATSDDAGEREIAGVRLIARGPGGLPLLKPPYGRVTCIDLNSGAHVWMRANGRGVARSPRFSQYHPDDAGSWGRAQLLATRTLLLVGEGPQDRAGAEAKLRAFDKQSGATIAEIDLPDFMLGAPMTYVADGEQYVVFSGGFRRWPHKLYALKAS
ncbi:MAG: PQQ-binding-like beta-propeller repeat protein [Hyphomonadaceae bacterium]